MIRIHLTKESSFVSRRIISWRPAHNQSKREIIRRREKLIEKLREGGKRGGAIFISRVRTTSKIRRLLLDGTGADDQ